MKKFLSNNSFCRHCTEHGCVFSQPASNNSAVSSSLTGGGDGGTLTKVTLSAPIQAFPIGAMCAKALNRARRSLAWSWIS